MRRADGDPVAFPHTLRSVVGGLSPWGGAEVVACIIPGGAGTRYGLSLTGKLKVLIFQQMVKKDPTVIS